jgi:non-homologous end joining protein Ku
MLAIVENSIKGCKVHTDTYVRVDKDELENLALERTRTIDIDELFLRPRGIKTSSAVGMTDSFSESQPS